MKFFFAKWNFDLTKQLVKFAHASFGALNKIHLQTKSCAAQGVNPYMNEASTCWRLWDWATSFDLMAIICRDYTSRPAQDPPFDVKENNVCAIGGHAFE